MKLIIVMISFGFLLQSCNDSSNTASNSTNTTSSSTSPLAWVVQLGTTTHTSGNLASANVGDESCSSVTTDSSGNIYCVGGTTGNLGEVHSDSRSHGPGYATNDAFVMKMDPTGKILWITQLGQTTKVSSLSEANQGDDICNAVTVDNSTGDVYCAGSTDGNLGEVNAYTPIAPNYITRSDGFILKLNSSGALQWVKQFGATTTISSPPANANAESDFCTGIGLSSDGSEVYCSGYTYGNMGEVNAGSADIFLASIITSSHALSWITQLGSITKVSSPPANANQGDDLCWSLAVSKTGSIYCSGSTNGNLGEVHSATSGNDAFIIKFSNTGGITWIKQLGSTSKIPNIPNANEGSDTCNSIAVDDYENVYCGGNTFGNLGDINTTENADAFVMKVSNSGRLIWITQTGQSTHVTPFPAKANQADDYCNSIAVDSEFNVYCAGYTYGNYGEINASTINPTDAFLMKLNSFGELDWIHQLGKTTIAPSNPVNANKANDYCISVTVNSEGNAICAGKTSGNIGEVNAGSTDIFVAKFN